MDDESEKSEVSITEKSQKKQKRLKKQFASFDELSESIIYEHSCYRKWDYLIVGKVSVTQEAIYFLPLFVPKRKEKCTWSSIKSIEYKSNAVKIFFSSEEASENLKKLNLVHLNGQAFVDALKERLSEITNKINITSKEESKKSLSISKTIQNKSTFSIKRAKSLQLSPVSSEIDDTESANNFKPNSKIDEHSDVEKSIIVNGGTVINEVLQQSLDDLENFLFSKDTSKLEKFHNELNIKDVKFVSESVENGNKVQTRSFNTPKAFMFKTAYTTSKSVFYKQKNSNQKRIIHVKNYTTGIINADCMILTEMYEIEKISKKESRLIVKYEIDYIKSIGKLIQSKMTSATQQKVVTKFNILLKYLTTGGGLSTKSTDSLLIEKQSNEGAKLINLTQFIHQTLNSQALTNILLATIVILLILIFCQMIK